jgi:ligand-binding sensor domain-containing protein
MLQAFSIAQDAGGIIWVGSNWGLLRFDGNSWSFLKPSSAAFVINTIAIDSKGNIWCGTNGSGIGKFNGNEWTIYNKTNGISSNFISSIAIDSDDNIWAGSNLYLSKFDGSDWINLSS